MSRCSRRCSGAALLGMHRTPCLYRAQERHQRMVTGLYANFANAGLVSGCYHHIVLSEAGKQCLS